MDVTKIHNMVVAALTDEEDLDQPRCTGTLILQNRMQNEIS